MCNYRDAPIPDDWYEDFNPQGTNEFEFVNAKVTSVVNKDGVVSSDATDPAKRDPLVGRGIIGNWKGPLAKLSDMSTRDPEIFSVFGLRLGIKWSEGTFPEKDKRDIAFEGDVARFVVTQGMWVRSPGLRVSTQFASTITVDNWGTMHPPAPEYTTPKDSEVLTDLAQALWKNNVNMENYLKPAKLSLRVTLYYTTRRSLLRLPYNASLGYMVGSIGVHNEYPEAAESRDPNVIYDTANIPGQRVLAWNKELDKPLGLKMDTNEDFDREKVEQWVHDAPFEVSSLTSDKWEVRLDLSNSILTDFYGSLVDIGCLQLARLDVDQSGGSVDQIGDSGLKCVVLLGKELSYTSDDRFYKEGGIHSVIFQYSGDLTKVPLGLVQVGEYGSSDLCLDGAAAISTDRAQILLRENPYFVRPMGYYNDFMEKGHDGNKATKKVYVTSYGQPADGVTVNAILSVQSDSGPPETGVVMAEHPVTTTKDHGVATFTFKFKDGVTINPSRRQYYQPKPCQKNRGYTLPIDGQVNHYYYCADKVCNKDLLTFLLAYGEYLQPSTPNWVDDVHPILSQYAHVSPVMTKIIDLANYTEVVWSKEMMKMALKVEDLDDPAYMPTTRDLSKEKRKMILKWLDNPRFDATDSTRTPYPGAPECVAPPGKCTAPEKLHTFEKDHCNDEMHFGKQTTSQRSFLLDLQSVTQLFDMPFCSEQSNDSNCISKELELETLQLYGLTTDLLKEYTQGGIYSQPKCDEVKDLHDKLQQALYLEWSTIPVYLTSLYSIVEGCNHEIYELIQSVVREEMLHFAQVANTLVALGVTPQIDNDVVSKAMFGKTPRLPGGVLPNLKVSLEKLSLKHVRRLFMAIEVPQSRTNPQKHTIGWFYHEIEKCINTLASSSILTDASFVHNKGKQVIWPRQDDALVKVSDISTALKGIEKIVIQGEGSTDFLVKDQIPNRLNIPHFYMFEEIVCQKRLKEIDDKTYSYSGAAIPFNENGVWPMRSNPTIASIPVNSNCYIESRAFHHVYRMLLRKLQDVYDGGPQQEDDLKATLQLMESLQAHAKILMMTKKTPDCTLACEICTRCNGCASSCEKCEACEACGPVWEYDWPDPAKAEPKL